MLEYIKLQILLTIKFILDAAKFLNISRSTISRRVKSDKYPQYYKKYVKKL